MKLIFYCYLIEVLLIVFVNEILYVRNVLLFHRASVNSCNYCNIVCARRLLLLQSDNNRSSSSLVINR